MSSITFSSGKVIPSLWLNDVNNLVWGVFNGAVTTAQARTALNVSQTGSDTTYAFRANNLSDLSNTVTALSNLGGAPLASPTFTGVPAAPTAAPGTNTTQIATTAFVSNSVSAVGTIMVQTRGSNTILQASDKGNLISATAAFTQTITAAATLGNGWSVFYRNDSTGIVPLSPAAGTIDGAISINLFPGESCLIVCSGSAFFTEGRGRGFVLVNRQSVSNVATVDFSLTNLAETTFAFELVDVLPITNNSTLRARFSQSGTFVTTAGYIAERGGTVAGVRFDAGTSSVAQIDIWAGLQTVAANSVANFNARVNLRNPANTTLAKQIDWSGASNNISGYTKFDGSGTYAGTGFATAVDGVRFLMDTGNLTGVFTMYALRTQ